MIQCGDQMNGKKLRRPKAMSAVRPTKFYIGMKWKGKKNPFFLCKGFQITVGVKCTEKD